MTLLLSSAIFTQFSSVRFQNSLGIPCSTVNGGRVFSTSAIEVVNASGYSICVALPT